MRRTFVGLVAMIVLMLGLSTVLAQEQPSGTVISYNTPENWANWGAVLRAFTEATGIEAPSDPKNSGQTLAALEAEAAAPLADVAYFGIVFGIQAAEAELVVPYQPPGFDDIPENLRDADGLWMTIHQGAVAFLVNTDELGDTPVPQCWSDLLDPAYEGLVGFLDPTQAAIGYSVITAANLALGGDFENFEPGIEYFRQLNQNDLSLPAQTATAMVQQGEIPILIDADFNGYRLANVDEAPIEVVIPCEGSLTIPYVISLVKDGPNPLAGQAFIDFVLSDEGQQLFAESYLRPVREVEVDESITEVMLPAEEYERVQAVDYAAMTEARQAYLDLWTADVIE